MPFSHWVCVFTQKQHWRMLLQGARFVPKSPAIMDHWVGIAVLGAGIAVLEEPESRHGRSVPMQEDGCSLAGEQGRNPPVETTPEGHNRTAVVRACSGLLPRRPSIRSSPARRVYNCMFFPLRFSARHAQVNAPSGSQPSTDVGHEKVLTAPAPLAEQPGP